MKKNDILSWFISAGFVLLLGWFSISNFGAVSKPLKKFIRSRGNIGSLSAEISDAMKSNKLFLKDELININGLYGRISGRRLYNDVVLLNNGMLTAIEDNMKDIGEPTEALTEFRHFMKKRGARFLYVQFPFKIDLEGKLAPDGLDIETPEVIESTLQAYKTAGIDVIDTTAELTGSPGDIEENFYRTDHHWKPSCAFKAFRIIMEHLAELYPEENFPHDILDITKWTIHEIPEQFLGSRGKRVGKLFAGLDSLQWMTPDFETDLSMYIPQLGKFVKGNYEDVFIQTEYLQKGLNVQHTNHYSVYIGKDYPLIQIRNPEAPSPLKVLLIKDSYALPLITFFSTMFREVDAVDPRYNFGSSIQEYADRSRPDIVIMATYSAAGINGPQFYKFSQNNDRYLKESEFPAKGGSIILAPSENSNNYEVFFGEFKNNRLYTLDIPQIQVTDGKTDAVSAALYDEETGKIISETMFDTAFCSEFGNCRWTVKTPAGRSDHLRLLLYAGMRDHTENTGVIYRDLRLFENETIK